MATAQHEGKVEKRWTEFRSAQTNFVICESGRNSDLLAIDMAWKEGRLKPEDALKMRVEDVQKQCEPLRAAFNDALDNVQKEARRDCEKDVE